MNAVSLQAVPPQPWRNGGGRTRELLAWPDADDWVLRVSVAEIDRDGDFSAWPGIDRWFAVVSGAGLRLALPQGDLLLGRASAPLAFAGEAAPACRLAGGPTQDLNLMIRRDRGNGDMRHAHAGSRATGIADWRALYTADALTLEIDGATMPVAAETLVWVAHDAPIGWQVLESDACAWWLSWRAR
jgi:environmental stress-induced protein Ves